MDVKLFNMLIGGKEKHAKLVAKIKIAPDREWINTYFDLAQELITCTGLKEDDPRLVMSIPSGKTLPITINHRYVLAAFEHGKTTVGFILGADYRHLPEIQVNTISYWQFKRLRAEFEFEIPWFLRFSTVPDIKDFKEQWKQAALQEIDRAVASPYQKYHQPLFYAATMNLDYRKLLLDEAFPPKE